MVLQTADSFEIEPNLESKGDPWVFTDLGFGISIELLLQRAMLRRSTTCKAGREVFHVDTTCAKLNNRTQPFDALCNFGRM